MKSIKMATGFGSVTKQQWLLSCGTLMIGSSIVLGWASQVLAVNVPAGPIWSNG